MALILLNDFSSFNAQQFCIVNSEAVALNRDNNMRRASFGKHGAEETILDLEFRGAEDALSRGEFIAACLTTTCEPGLSKAVRAAVRHLTQHYAEPVTLEDLSSVTKLNAYQLIRAFRRELGTTPHAWLIGYRVEMGTALLRAGESIATVASEVGFVDQTHFTRHFKRVHGETPARFLVARGCFKSDLARDGRAFRHGTHFEMARP